MNASNTLQNRRFARVMPLVIAAMACAALLARPGRACAADTPPAPRIASVKPSVSYPDDHHRVTITVMGDNFAPKGKGENILIIDGQEIPVDWAETPKNPDDPVGVQNSDYQLVFKNVPLPARRGAADVQIRVGNQRSPAVPVVFSAVPQRAPMIWAIAIVGLLFLIVFLALTRGKHVTIAERHYGLAAAFFLDPETDTYSLSKFQFFLWTFAAIFGYAYLVLARSLIQGFFTLPAPPQNMPGIVLLSAATTAVARGITNTRGAKGAGSVYPSFADFISSGGIVAPERFQFFAWTLLGVASFVGLVLFSDAGTIDKLPDVPDGFLYLMGASSAGYLGGKATRKAGPIIDEIRTAMGSLILEIRGRNLATTPFFKIGGVNIPYDRVGGKETATALPTGNTLEIIELEPGAGAGEPEFAKAMRLVIGKPEEDWVSAKGDQPKPQLTLENSDGQRATWPFKVPEATVATTVERVAVVAAPAVAVSTPR